MGFVHALLQRRVTSHIATDSGLSIGVVPRSGGDGRTGHHPGYAVSQRIRKRIEEVFGWVKSPLSSAKLGIAGRDRAGGCFDLAATAYNLIRRPVAARGTVRIPDGRTATD